MLAFVFGASQLCGTSFACDSILKSKDDDEAPFDSMYHDCIQFIMKVKTGCPFENSSPKLFELS